MKKTIVALTLLNMFLALPLASAQTTSARGTPEYTGKAPETASNVVPEEIKGVTIEEKLGQSIDLTLPVRNESGQIVPLSTFFHNKKPVMLSPIYYNCPGLCSFHFNGVVEALKKIDWSPDDKFNVVAFSFDAKEGSELGVKKKANYMKMYGRAGTENGFHFLTADQNTIDKLMDQVGFRYKWNAAANEWSHASAAIIISPEGKISRYLHGVDFDPRDMKLALNEASKGHIGNIIDSFVLYCFKYDQHQSKYGLQVFRVVQLGGAITVLILAIWLLPVLYRAGREKV